MEDSKELSSSLSSSLSSLNDLPESTFSTRLLTLKGESESENKFAQRCKVPLSSMRKYLSGSIPAVDKAVEIARALNISFTWLATGEGPMRREELNDYEKRQEDLYLQYAGDDQAAARNEIRWQGVSEQAKRASLVAHEAAKNKGLSVLDEELIKTVAFTKPNDPDFISTLVDRLSIDSAAVELSQEFAMIPGYSVQVSAGSGTFPDTEQPSRRLAFRHKWLRFRGLNEKDLVLVFAKGDSMEPTIEDNNTLMIDTSQRELNDGSIYVIRSNDHLIVKRVQRLLNQAVLLISDNRAYQPIQVNLDTDDLQVIGRVVWIGKDA